jgi:F-type H+-transporting ATPase subunit gamma
MSQSINEIKAKILATQNMSKITNAMQMISVAKLTKSEGKLKNNKEYVNLLKEMMEKTLEASVAEDHIFFQPKAKKSCTAYLVITSDRGLAGGYNSKVLKLLSQTIEGSDPQDYKLYMVGKKAFDFSRRMNLTVENDYVFMPDDLVYADMMPVVGKVVADYVEGVISEVVIVYHDYISKLTQEPATRCVLPLPQEKLNPSLSTTYLFEPNKKKMTQALLLKYLNSNVYEVLLRAKLAEHASRMNAMQNATDNAVDIIKESQLIYNRARQAAITQEINEIVGGAVALKKKKV